REPKIAVARTAGQRLCPFQANATRCISVEIEPANVRQDVLISMTSGELAEAAGFVIDAEIKAVGGTKFDDFVAKIFRVFFRLTLGRLLPQQGLVLRGHELTPRREPFVLRHRE